MITIGFLSYRSDPIPVMPYLRLRAMVAEAKLQEAEFFLVHWKNYNIEKGTIQAEKWSPDNTWRTEIAPLPDVVMIMGNPLSEQQKKLEEWILRSRKVIADRGENKLKTSEIFRETDCEKYLIPWAMIDKENPAVFIRDFVEKESGAVVKRADSNKGVGIFFILEEDGVWKVLHDDNVFTGSVAEVSEYVNKKIAGRLQYRDFIIQKYIPAKTPDGRSFDVRVHVQRRFGGVWGITRNYMRLSECNSPLPNTSRGGYQGSIESYLKHRNSEDSMDLVAKIEDAAINIAEIQSGAAIIPLSELGIDFVIDSENRIWLIETNALPQSMLHEQERAIHSIGYAISLMEDNL